MTTNEHIERSELIAALRSERRWHDLTDAQLDQAAAPKPQATTSDDHPLMHNRPTPHAQPDMEASE